MGKEVINSFNEELNIVARESAYIYGASLLSVFTGFVYWIIAAKLVPSTLWVQPLPS